MQEEEDVYDKVAVGKEKSGDRLYMKDIADCGIEIDSCTELPTSLRNFIRDPRANHLAAKVRLKEDAEASKTTDSLPISENVALPIADPECNASPNPKSILKRKDNHIDVKSQKRVRFNPECKISQDFRGSKDISMEGNSSPEDAYVCNEATFSSAGYRTQVPDYIQNPSRYTHYTFDSSYDVDDEFNRKAYLDFLQLVRGSKTMESHEDDASAGPPKYITFIPKKKAGDTVMIENSALGSQNDQNGAGKEVAQQRGIAIGIDNQTDEVCSMEEDEPDKLELRRNSSQKPGRQYRMRAKMESEEEEA